MARKTRVEVDGGLYHVIARGNDRQDIFHSKADHEKFLTILAQQKAACGFLLYAYCLMTNHVHLLIERQAESIGRVMQRLLTGYSQHYNRKYRRVGHVFQGRHKAILCQSEVYPDGRTFTYDGENKQIEVDDAYSATLGQYLYDGDGKRVIKYVGNDTTIFIYDAMGRSVEEYVPYSGPPPPPGFPRPDPAITSYVYAGSRLLSTENADGSTTYLTADHLGSPRINTNGSGSVVSRHDYMPFGEEIDGTGGRTTGLNYGDDTVRKQFTGYERNDETDLEFATARMYSKSLGRFTSSDPSLLSVNGFNPQSWNRYTYVMNRSLIYTDPSGLWAIGYWITYKRDENGKVILDKKGRPIIESVTFFFYKTKDDDNGASLARQLGLEGKDSEKFANEVDSSSDNSNYQFFLPQKAETRDVRDLFSFMSTVFTSQANRLIKGKDPDDSANCAGTSCELALRDFLRPSLISPSDFDQILAQSFDKTDESGLRFRDVVRYATDDGQTPQHFTTFIFREDDGVPIVFSKSGTEGAYQIGPSDAFEKPIYGKISGYFHRK